jgi:hypothetical protein
MNQTIINTCASCGKNIKGRTDKKFCNDYCRHLFHNKNKIETDNIEKKINNILSRNRKIIKTLFESEDFLIKIKREELLEMGFIFRHYTHSKRKNNGSCYYYCYDYGYILLEKEYCLLIKQETAN